MKKMLVSLLALMLLLGTTAFAQEAEEFEIRTVTLDFDDIEYEGNWWSFKDMNFTLYLPADWVETPNKLVGGANYEFAVGTEDESAFVNIRIILDDSEEDYATRFQQMLAEVGASDAASEVEAVKFNDVDMITYAIGENVGFGAVILADDAFLMFETAPGTEENAATFLQILSTYTLAAE